MYLKRNYGYVPKPFAGVFEDMFQNGWNKWNEEATSLLVPVNIHETEKSFDMQVVAPGIKKEEFKINIDKNILTISYDHKEEKAEQQDGKLLRSEYQVRSFRRSFTLNDTINIAEISAQYADGVLQVTLPKKDESVRVQKEITIK
jgi:HSP20 family protein